MSTENNSEVEVDYNADSQYFHGPMSQSVFYRSYSQRRGDRRETWPETVHRAAEYLRELSHNKLSAEDYSTIESLILRQKIMPSMRLLATAGPAARRNPISIYNCAAAGVSELAVFKEAMTIEMCGTGFGYSVERRYVEKLPTIRVSPFYRNYSFIINDKATFTSSVEIDIESYSSRFPLLQDYLSTRKWPLTSPITYRVDDSAEGWADALEIAIYCAYDAIPLELDYSYIRPAGTLLKTKGGTASGPAVLEKLMTNVTAIIRDAVKRPSNTPWWHVLERKLRPIEVHSIMCHIGEASISGGHRRSALLAACDHNDTEMLSAKSPDNYHYAGYGYTDNLNTHFSNANISAVFPYGEETTYEQFSTVFDAMIASGMGEPGFLNQNQKSLSRRDAGPYITNPCGEIKLDPRGQFCNLSSVVIRATDTLEEMLHHIKYATIIGTIQSSATQFAGLRPIWQQLAESDPLLGVDLNGIQSNKLLQLNSPNLMLSLVMLRETAIKVNKEYAALLGIKASKAVTTIKPSGSSSVVLCTCSGIHPWPSPYYIRRVEYDQHSPVWKIHRDAAAPMRLKQGQQDNQTGITKWLVEYPIAAPAGAIVEGTLSAIEMLQHIIYFLRYYTEHNVSCSVYYRPQEVSDLKQFVWQNLDSLNGITFFPVFAGILPNPVYETITEAEYKQRLAAFPTHLNFNNMTFYDNKEDVVMGDSGLSCTAAGGCETL